MVVILTNRATLITDLRSYGEEVLAALIPSVSDAQLKKIGERGGWHAMHGPGHKDGSSMLLSKALVLGAIEVLEGTPREPKWKRR